MPEIDLAKYNQCRESCINSLQMQSEPYQKMMIASDMLLYHYTDVHGLLGVIESNTLWATESAFLSDPVELHYAATVMIETIKSYCSNNPHTLSVDELAMMRMLPLSTAYNTDLRELVGFDTHAYRPEDVYTVISFSTEDDALILWREYADSGNGYALALTKSEIDGNLRSGPLTSIGTDYIMGVLYSPDLQQSLISELVTICLTYYRENDIDFDTVIHVLDTELKRLLPLFKPDYYAHENEVRYIGAMANSINWSLIGSSNPFIPHSPLDIIFSAKNGIIVPRIRLSPADGKQLSIQEIVIGPSLDQDMAEVGLRRLCHRHFSEGQVHIRRSNVPYRSHL